MLMELIKLEQCIRAVLDGDVVEDYELEIPVVKTDGLLLLMYTLLFFFIVYIGILREIGLARNLFVFVLLLS